MGEVPLYPHSSREHVAVMIIKLNNFRSSYAASCKGDFTGGGLVKETANSERRFPGVGCRGEDQNERRFGGAAP